MTINTNEQDSTSTVRIMPPRKVWEPVYIKLKNLEVFQEIEQERGCKPVQEFNTGNH